jgi:hypothetical protein
VVVETVKGRRAWQDWKRVVIVGELEIPRQIGFLRALGAACAMVRERRGSIAGDVETFGRSRYNTNISYIKKINKCMQAGILR